MRRWECRLAGFLLATFPEDRRRLRAAGCLMGTTRRNAALIRAMASSAIISPRAMAKSTIMAVDLQATTITDRSITTVEDPQGMSLGVVVTIAGVTEEVETTTTRGTKADTVGINVFKVSLTGNERYAAEKLDVA